MRLPIFRPSWDRKRRSSLRSTRRRPPLEDHVPIEEQALQGGPDVLDRHLRRFGLGSRRSWSLAVLSISRSRSVTPMMWDQTSVSVRRRAVAEVIVAGRRMTGVRVTPGLLRVMGVAGGLPPR